MKLHLGCGRRYIPGWIHIDAQSFPHVDHVACADDLHMVPDASCEVVYACHILEHFPRSQTLAVLSEWRRVLLPGGTLRVAVPDLPALFGVYLHDSSPTGPNDVAGDLSKVIGSLYGRQDSEYNIHYTGFDYPTLATLLVQAGFQNPRRYNRWSTEHAHVDDYSAAYLPHMDFEKGTLISLNVEATRPSE